MKARRRSSSSNPSAIPTTSAAFFDRRSAFGARAMLLGPACADPLYRKTVRTSMAAVLALPFAEASPWPDMLVELRATGYTLVALTPEASAEPLPVVAASLGRTRVALLLGSEGEGLSPAALAAVDRRVRIPMAPALDSLNVATAAAVALYALSAVRDGPEIPGYVARLGLRAALGDRACRAEARNAGEGG